MAGRFVQIAVGGGLVAATAGRALADTPALGPPVTNRNYAIELYDNAAIGNDATIAMGGAAVANASGSSGTLINPSAPAVRATTDLGSWSWDYHLDYLNSSFSTDTTNSGVVESNGTGTSAFTGGLALREHTWAFAVTAYWQTTQLDATTPLSAQTLNGKLAFADWVEPWDMAIGAALVSDQFSLIPSSGQSLFSITGGGLEGGATWIPRLTSLRLGADLATPITGGKVTVNGCGDPTDCMGYVLPTDIVSAWRVAAGGAYRFAPTAWNQPIHAAWRDEHAVTAVADVVVYGPTKNAFGLEAFGKHELQRSGEHAAYSVRGGVEYEWLPGRLRVRGGSYWEPGRLADADGRLHGTFGLELRAGEFDLWGPRRGQLTLTSDVAARYRNVGVSIGFWH
jgi:hypothetical protein